MFEDASAPDGAGRVVPVEPLEIPAEPPVVLSGAVLSGAVLALRAAVRVLAEVDLSALSGPAVLAQTAAVLVEAQRLQAVGLAHLAEVDGRALHHLDGAPSTARWADRHGLETARGAVAVARRLRQFPAVGAALLSGRLPLTAAQQLQVTLARWRQHTDRPDALVDGQPGEAVLAAVLGDGIVMAVAAARGGYLSVTDPSLARLRADLTAIINTSDSQLARAEAALLVLAAHVEPGQLAGCLGGLADALLPQQLEGRVRRGRDRRYLRLVPDGDGGYRISGQLDLACGERLFAVLAAELTRDPDAPADTALARELREQGLDPHDPELGAPDVPRSTGEQLHDALDHVLGRYLAAGLIGSHDRNPVQIVVTISADTLDGAPGAPAAHTATGNAVPVSLVRRWACHSALTRHTLDLRGKVIVSSHTARTLKPHERRALRTQTGGRCQGAGCRRGSHDPWTVLHPHHGNPWAGTGTTSLADTVLLCERCHHHVHDGQHPLRLKDGRRLGPDGWLE